MFALLSLASRYVSDRSLVLLGTAVLLFSLLWHAVTIPSFEKGCHFLSVMESLLEFLNNLWGLGTE
jgi:hypothetical protein